ncbi:MAG: DUF1232 domain-containing protein [Cyclobacteriaceae bacterium]
MDQKVEKIFNKAKKAVNENERLNNLITEATEKIKTSKFDNNYFSELVEYVGLMSRMVLAHLKGEYRAFSNKSLLMMVFGLLYFITPTDLIPDFMPGLGFADDISIIYYIIKTIREDVIAFQEWENSVVEIENNQ